jgi:hypothetical protein
VIPVYDFDETSKISGQADTDFSVSFYHEGVEESLDFTITEIGTTGDYLLEIADGFPDTGFWVINVQIDFNLSFWRTDVEVHAHDIDDVFLLISANIGSEPVTIHVVDQSDQDLPDVLVNIFNSSGTFLTSGRTDADGVLETTLDPGDYVIRLFSRGISFDIEEITVPEGGGEFEITGNIVGVSPPSDPQLCRLFADFVDLAGEAVEGFRIRVSNLFDPSADEGLAVVEGVEDHESDEDGHIEFDVVKGARLRVAFIGTKLVRTFTVPDESTANLLELMGQNTDNFAVVKAT